MRISWPLIAAAILVVAAAAYLVTIRTSSVASRRDSTSVILAEEKDVLRDASAAFTEDRLNVSGSHLFPLAQALGVRISGRNATLNVAGEMAINNLVYAYVWYEIYRK